MNKEVYDRIAVRGLLNEIEVVKKHLSELPKEEMINCDYPIGAQLVIRIQCLKETLRLLEYSRFQYKLEEA